MGQRVSTSEDPSNTILAKKDSQELKTKSKKSIEGKSLPNSPKNLKSSTCYVTS